MSTLRIHLAFDKFRGSLSQYQINSTVAALLPATAQVHHYIMADGGEGSLDALFELGWEPIAIHAADTLGSGKNATVAHLPGTNRYAIELAEICGVKWLRDGRNPRHSTTLGIGQAVEEVRKFGAEEILLFSGGSASNDGGIGVMQGLGIRIVDKKNRLVEFGLSGLSRAALIDRDDVDRVRELYSHIKFLMVHDTHASLIGHANCINLFGEQKGLGKISRYFAQRAMKRWARLLQSLSPHFDPFASGTGAAGGVTAPFAALFNATFVNGFDFFSRETGLVTSLHRDDLLFTGEGRFDKTSREKKIVMPAIQLAEKAGAQSIVVVGSLARDQREFLMSYRGIKKVFVVEDHAASLEESLSDASFIITRSLAHELGALK